MTTTKKHGYYYDENITRFKISFFLPLKNKMKENANPKYFEGSAEPMCVFALGLFLLD